MSIVTNGLGPRNITVNGAPVGMIDIELTGELDIFLQDTELTLTLCE